MDFSRRIPSCLPFSFRFGLRLAFDSVFVVDRTLFVSDPAFVSAFERAGVVGLVEAGAFELDGRRRHQLPHVAAAFLASGVWRIGELLDDLRPLVALRTLVFVNGHAAWRVTAIPRHVRESGRRFQRSIYCDQRRDLRLRILFGGEQHSVAEIDAGDAAAVRR